MKHELLCGDCLEVLPTLGHFDCLIADPFDNIDLKYNSYKDRIPKDKYRDFLWQCLNLFVEHAGISWVSYNAKWTWMMGSLIEDLERVHPDVTAKPFVQSFTFGQNNTRDCGPGHRPLVRLRHKGAPLYPDHIKVPSWRQLNGDKRAAEGGKVPLDCWYEFPRVVGNSKQRRRWHKTQLHEGLVERCIKFSTREGDTVCDVFSGTGTVVRVCKRIGRHSTSIELDPFYCEKISEENQIKAPLLS